MFSTWNVPLSVYLRIWNYPNPYVYRFGDILIEGHGHFVSFEFENMPIKAQTSWRKSKINKFFRWRHRGHASCRIRMVLYKLGFICSYFRSFYVYLRSGQIKKDIISNYWVLYYSFETRKYACTFVFQCYWAILSKITCFFGLKKLNCVQAWKNKGIFYQALLRMLAV